MFQSTVAPPADWALAVATQEATDKDSDVLHGKTAHESTVAASAVATKEATDEDSNMLRGKTACENAVAIRKAHMFANDWRIRKPAGAGNGYRLRGRRIGAVRIGPP